jgi:hypothetical protein
MPILGPRRGLKARPAGSFHDMFRRLRSALVLGVIWGAVWFPVGIVVGLVVTRLSDPTWTNFFSGLAAWTLIGVSSGATFALLVAIFERNRTIQQLAVARLALWGMIGGAALPVAAMLVLLKLLPGAHLSSSGPAVFVLMAALGSVCAIMTLWLARRNAPVPGGGGASPKF